MLVAELIPQRMKLLVVRANHIVTESIVDQSRHYEI